MSKRIELAIERGEIDAGIGRDPVVFAAWTGDEAVEAHGNVVAETAHGGSPRDRLFQVALNRGE